MERTVSTVVPRGSRRDRSTLAGSSGAALDPVRAAPAPTVSARSHTESERAASPPEPEPPESVRVVVKGGPGWRANRGRGHRYAAVEGRRIAVREWTQLWPAAAGLRP
jgi:hypothetical protein